MNRWKLCEMTYKELRRRKYEVAVLPVGSTEPHGFHLPYGCDSYHVEKVAERVCERADKLGAKVALLPTIPYGATNEMLDFPLTLSLKQATLNSVVSDLIRSLETHSIPKLLILNGHGGNDFGAYLRDMHRQTSLFVCSIKWWHVAGDVGAKLWERKGGHANEMETSVALELISGLVRMSDAGKGSFRKSRFEGVEKGWVQAILPWRCLTKDSGHGDPSLATKEKGAKFLNVVVERISGFIKELSDAPMSDKLPF